ncbi:hypothetical protein O9X98_06960 [Agrobacterium salinitolerans]|nr:hypothetical protein [Agrobacterium salinitolerans]
MTKRYYSGVGMREPEQEADAVIARFAKQAAADGFVLRTAKGKGVDRLFVTHHDGDKELIKDKLVPPPRAYEIAERHHGAWDLCDDRARKLHAMNVMIYLGPSLDSPVSFNLVWSPADIDSPGGSALGMRVCREFGIETFNLRNPLSVELFARWYDEKLSK